MTRSRVRSTLAILSAAAVLPPVVAPAAQQSFPATDHATITDEAGASRMLVLFDGLTDLDGEWIQSATLHLPLSGAIPADVDVMVDVPRTSWTSAASWNSPWTKGGGDPYDEQAVVRPAKAGRSGTLSLDVTHLVRSMAAGETPDNGFLLWPADGTRAGFSSAELSAFGSRSQVTLEVTYRKFSAHFKAGAQELVDRKRTIGVQ